MVRYEYWKQLKMLSYALGNLPRPGINFLKIRIMETGKNESAFKEVMMRQETAVKALQKVNNTLSKTLEAEMGYKNHAYFFILESGYFYEYLEYSKENEF